MTVTVKSFGRWAAAVFCCVAIFGGCTASDPPGFASGTTTTRTAIASTVVSKTQTMTTAAATGYIDYLVLVNRQQALPEGWEEHLDIVKVTNSLGYEVRVERSVYEAYLRLRDALAKENVYISINSGYRDYKYQQKLMKEYSRLYGEEYVEEYVAVPGYSEHQTGLALDLYLDFVKDAGMANHHSRTWEKVHAKLADFGFILRYPADKEKITGYAYEEWHIRYVGVAAAKEMAAKNLTLEEYKEEHHG